MNFFSTQTINLSDVLTEGIPEFRILLAEPEDARYGIYARLLREHKFVVHRSPNLESLLGCVRLHEPHLVICSLEFEPTVHKSMEALIQLRNSHPNLHIVSIGAFVDPHSLKSVVALGVSGHIDRMLTRPQDVVLLAKTVLNITK